MDGKAIFLNLGEAPYLFILSAEIMAENVRKTKEITERFNCLW